MVISSLEVGKSGLIAQPTSVCCVMLVLAISARCLMTFKAERFAVGRFVSAAAAYCSAVMRLPCSTFSLGVVLKYKLLSATFTLAVSIVENLALCFFGKSHCRVLSQRVNVNLPFRSDCSGQVLCCSFQYFMSTTCANDGNGHFLLISATSCPCSMSRRGQNGTFV